MINWAKKTWLSALLIASILTVFPDMPHRAMMAIFVPAIIGTAWTKLDSRGENL